MKKQDKKKAPRVRKAPAIDIDWTPLFKAFTLFKALKEALEWALDVAAALAREFPEDVEAVERVRSFMRARVAGQAVNVSVDDVLFTFGLLIGAIDRDLGPIGAEGPGFAPPLTHHFPGSPERSPRVPRVFVPHSVWSYGAPTHFAGA